MANDGPGVGSKGERSDAGEGPQTLAQLQGTGAEVVGSDGEKVGDLKTVGDADIVVGRPLLRCDLHAPVARVREVTSDNRVVLDVSAEEAKEARWGGPSTDTRRAPPRSSPRAPGWRKGRWNSSRMTRKRPSSWQGRGRRPTAPSY